MSLPASPHPPIGQVQRHKPDYGHTLTSLAQTIAHGEKSEEKKQNTDVSLKSRVSFPIISPGESGSASQAMQAKSPALQSGALRVPSLCLEAGDHVSE